MSPRSSVQTQRPCMPVRLSEKPIACAMNPTAGRCAPVSSTDPVRSKMAARSSGPRWSVRRVPAAVHVPSNASHSPAGRVSEAGSPDRPHAAVRRKAANISHRHPATVTDIVDKSLAPYVPYPQRNLVHTFSLFPPFQGLHSDFLYQLHYFNTPILGKSQGLTV